MALARSKTWIAGEILTASDLNAEFNNILNNAISLISPLTAALDFNGFELILDADGDTSFHASTDDQIDVKIAGSDDFKLTANLFDVLAGSVMKITGVETWTKGADVTAATDLLVNIDGNIFDVTGATTIATIASKGVGTHIILQFDSTPQITHDATNLVLPGGANITAAAGDVMGLHEYASADWRCEFYTKADGTAVVAASGDLVNDTTPQLGGDLDLNSKNIDFPTTANISDCLDEDNMATNSAVVLATQQSIKAYADSVASTFDVQTFTGSGTWTDPGNVTKVLVMLWAAGGGGARETTQGGGGGGGGAHAVAWFDVADTGATETVTIGAGGIAISGSDADGNGGGNSTFGSLLTVFGGGGGNSGAAQGGGGGGLFAVGSSGGGAGGGPLGGAVGSGGDGGASTFGGGGGGDGGGTFDGGVSVDGGGGGGGGSNATVGNGGNSYNGGGGGGAGAGTTAGTGGVSVLGGNGGAGNDGASNATAGTQPAGGGGGSETGDSGAGAPGQCIVISW